MEYTPLNRTPRKEDVVCVVKKTRGRFPKTMPVATKGEIGVVISSWTSSYGSHKICILTEDHRQIGTTASCVHVIKSAIDSDDDDNPHWGNILISWMDKTYVPIIVNKIGGYKGRGWAMSKSKSSILVKPLSGNANIWLSKDKVHPHDIEKLMNDEQCCSVRVPVWLANKGGVFGVV